MRTMKVKYSRERPQQVTYGWTLEMMATVTYSTGKEEAAWSTAAVGLRSSKTVTAVSEPDRPASL